MLPIPSFNSQLNPFVPRSSTIEKMAPPALSSTSSIGQCADAEESVSEAGYFHSTCLSIMNALHYILTPVYDLIDWVVWAVNGFPNQVEWFALYPERAAKEFCRHPERVVSRFIQEIKNDPMQLYTSWQNSKTVVIPQQAKTDFESGMLRVFSSGTKDETLVLEMFAIEETGKSADMMEEKYKKKELNEAVAFLEKVDTDIQRLFPAKVFDTFCDRIIQYRKGQKCVDLLKTDVIAHRKWILNYAIFPYSQELLRDVAEYPRIADLVKEFRTFLQDPNQGDEWIRKFLEIADKEDNQMR